MTDRLKVWLISDRVRRSQRAELEQRRAEEQQGGSKAKERVLETGGMIGAAALWQLANL